jgi:hypothetical protein
VSTPEYLVVSKQSFDFSKTGLVPCFGSPAKLARRKMYRVRGRLLCVVQVQARENAGVLLNCRADSARQSS